MHTFVKVSAFGLAMAMVSDGLDARSLRTGPDAASEVCPAAAARAPSLIVRGLTAADICEPFDTRTTDAGASVGMLLGFWSAGLVVLARLGW